jgi:hypothetical protein
MWSALAINQGAFFTILEVFNELTSWSLPERCPQDQLYFHSICIELPMFFLQVIPSAMQEEIENVITR